MNKVHAEQKPRGCSIFDFEKYPLEGWTSSGNAFKSSPIIYQNSMSSHHHGNWYVNSKINMTSPCLAPGYQVAAKGTLTSPYFEIRASSLTFLIGGGCDVSTTRVELLINGLIKFKTAGDCNETLSRKSWNTSHYIGKIAQIRIVDESDAFQWAYISFDDLRTSSSCQDLQACKSNQSMCLESKDDKTEVICHCGTSYKNSLPCGDDSLCNISRGSCHSICAINDCACQECSCKSGYQFNKTSLKCEDVDECALNSGGCHYACVNTLGGYHCTCQEGYRLDSDKKSCIDIDECKLVKNGGCHQHSLCSNSEGSFSCVCFQGWTKNLSNPLQCLDKDECALSSPCKPTQSCVNTLGSYRCDCGSGYKTDEFKSCVDIDECQTMNGGCDHVCTNSQGSFRCSCKIGYTLSSNGKTCSDINECASNNGGCQHRCYNYDGSYKCGCNPGYSLGNDNVTCQDINECMSDANCSHICTNEQGGYKCSCRQGYALNNDNHNCRDIDECLSNKGNCSQNCKNTQGGYSCTCNQGYDLHDDGRACIDVDECLGNNQCEQLCTNTEGSFQCSCLPGFKLQDNERSCQDVNECELHPNQLCERICINTPGSYLCSCPQGYALNPDNKTCSDVDECNDGSTCEQTCTNEIGSYKCSCNQGYVLAYDNKSCHDINECLEKDTCDHECVNNNGSHHCLCSKGYSLASDKKSCLDIDECLNNNVCQEICTNTIGSYKCSCESGKVLQSDGKTCKVPAPLNEAIDTAKKGIQDAKSSSEISEATKAVCDSFSVAKKITSKDIEGTVEVLEQIESKVKNVPTNSTVPEMKDLLKSYLEVASFVIDPQNKPSWESVSQVHGSSKGAASIPGKVENMTDALFHSVKNEDIDEINVNISDKNIKLQLNIRKRNTFKGFQYESKSSKVTLDESLVKDSDNDELIGVSYATFPHLGDLISCDVNSDVVSINVLNVNKKYLADLPKPVVLKFNHREPTDNDLPLCSFINENRKCPECEPLWSTEGCWVNMSSDGVTVCMCNHTTSYGLLMDVHGIYDTLADTHKEALKYISLIGCCVSICFCALTVLALTLTMRHPMEKKARFETFKLHINLVVAIGLSQIWFVIGSFLVNVNLVACRVVSIFTHYFLTASFCWMLVEGINVYNKIVKVFSTKKYGKFYFTLGWGFPLIMVIVTSAAVFNKYGPQNICWLHKDVIWVFAVPVMVVIVANLFVLLSVVYVLLRKTMAFAATPNKPKENTKAKRTVKITVVLLPLLGLTWVFGFLAIDKNFIVFHYLFAIINSLQGFFIFVAHCWINDSIRRALLEKLPSLPQSLSKYHSSTKSGGVGGDGDGQKQSQIESNAFDNETCSASVPMPVHITMSTVQLLNLRKNSPEPRRSEAINDCMEHISQLPNFAQ